MARLPVRVRSQACSRVSISSIPTTRCACRATRRCCRATSPLGSLARALRAADVASATSETPITLLVAQEFAARPYAELPALPLRAVARIFTGAPIPPGADSVIPQERVTRRDDALVFDAPWPAHKNIRR